MQWLGLYVASFLLVAGFMRVIGRIALWKSLLTGFLFAVIMFVTFDVAFDVIMPKGPARSGLRLLGSRRMEACQPPASRLRRPADVEDRWR